MGTESQTYSNAAAVLTRGESHRVWSLIVTIFGDLARREGEGISGAALSQLVGLMGVKPEAMRVALHRLRKDGWIDSRREGRGSLHALTAFGRQQSAEASPRIYDRHRAFPELWHLLIAGNAEQTGRGRLESVLLTGDYLPVGAQVLVGPGPLPEGLGGLFGVETGRFRVPGWLRGQVCPPELLTQYRDLESALIRVAEILGKGAPLAGMETAALRLLAVHSWRRLLFRHPDLPEAFFPEDWPGPRCRVLFCDLMDRLQPPSLAVLEDCA